jgi:hypothetical protein
MMGDDVEAATALDEVQAQLRTLRDDNAQVWRQILHLRAEIISVLVERNAFFARNVRPGGPLGPPKRTP